VFRYTRPVMVWTSTSNTSIFPSFVNELGKNQTKGSWIEDYHDICQAQHLIPCPFVKVESLNFSDYCSCKVMNCILDTGTWRSILVACSTVGNKILEISLHNVEISSAHLDDLLQLFLHNMKSNLELLSCLKFDYLSLSNTNQQLFYSSLKSLLSSSNGLKYLSLVGNQITDEIFQELLTPIRNHCTLEGINLNHNLLTDQAMISFLNILPYAIRLNSFSFKSNSLTGHSLHSLLSLFHGSPYSNEQDAEVKMLNKLIQERNKVIKDLNKKAKKESKDSHSAVSGGELHEIEPLTNRIVKQQDTTSLIFNHSLRFIDLSWNLSISPEHLLAFQTDASSALSSGPMPLVASTPGSLSPRKEGGGASSPAPPHLERSVLTICLRGLGGEAIHNTAGGEDDVYSGRLKILM
jgi:hypothetical protein